MRRSVLATVLLMASLGLTHCDCSGGGTTPAPPAIAAVLAKCGLITGIQVTGTSVTPGTSAVNDIGTTASITNTSGNAITWSTGGTATPTDPMSGTSATGTAAKKQDSDPEEYVITATGTDGSGKTLTINGSITIGPPCKGSGTWSIKNSAGLTIATGSWSF